MNWISIDTPPTKSMKVEWLYEDGKTDVGYYYSDSDTFASNDLNSNSAITHWKPLERTISAETYESSGKEY